MGLVRSVGASFVSIVFLGPTIVVLSYSVRALPCVDRPGGFYWRRRLRQVPGSARVLRSLPQPQGSGGRLVFVALGGGWSWQYHTVSSSSSRVTVQIHLCCPAEGRCSWPAAWSCLLALLHLKDWFQWYSLPVRVCVCVYALLHLKVWFQWFSLPVCVCVWANFQSIISLPIPPQITATMPSVSEPGQFLPVHWFSSVIQGAAFCLPKMLELDLTLFVVFCCRDWITSPIFRHLTICTRSPRTGRTLLTKSESWDGWCVLWFQYKSQGSPWGCGGVRSDVC